MKAVVVMAFLIVAVLGLIIHLTGYVELEQQDGRFRLHNNTTASKNCYLHFTGGETYTVQLRRKASSHWYTLRNLKGWECF